MASTGRHIETTIRNKLHKTLEATHLEIINESHLHSGISDAETHFRVVIVSKKFEDLSLIQRHRLVNDTLRDEFRINIRGLSIVAKTPEQWAAGDQLVETSPKRQTSFGISCNKTNNSGVARWP